LFFILGQRKPLGYGGQVNERNKFSIAKCNSYGESINLREAMASLAPHSATYVFTSTTVAVVLPPHPVGLSR